ncbi:MAG TPA: SHOCT domain-containing protein [Thiohalobacter sp.]|nr:SHOCT domain-containing protein [Thiohalobacter sp.]
MHSEDWGWGFLGHGIGLLFWIVAIVLIVGLVVGLSGRGGGGGSRSTPSAREILKQRYAKGEIDREEYERKMKDLER